MDYMPPGIRRVCVAVEAESGSDVSVRDTGSGLSSALADACFAAGLDRTLLTGANPGHGEVALLPVGIDEPRALACLLDGLSQALGRINGNLADGQRVRLRMAIHEGIAILAGDGFRGRAITKTRRMASCQPLRDALAHHEWADLAVMLSDQVFDEVSAFGHAPISTGSWRRAETAISPAGPADIGWICVLGQAGPAPPAGTQQ